MRFNDMLATVMAQPQTDAVSRQIVWRQLIDILAQSPDDGTSQSRTDALIWLGKARPEISPVVRASVARSIASRITSSDLIGYFASDDPAVAAPILSQARLNDDAWRTIVPKMPPASRALLRERRDLSDGVTTALASYGRADFALNAPDDTQDAQAKKAPQINGATPIAEIVARIEAFRAKKAEHPETQVQNDTQTTAFLFETDVEGILTFIADAPREALLGMSIASAGEDWLCGVDGHAAGAFRARAAFRSARLCVAGEGATSGDWLINGDPVFEPQHGKFLGFRGSARRPMSHERAQPLPVELPPEPINSDGLRQVVHELRTPLNAILGFAEMIERQMLGPINEAYRERARRISAEGNRLLSAIEDVDIAARIQSKTLEAEANTSTDAAALLTLVGREFIQLTETRGVHLRITRSANALLVHADRRALHRLFSRLLGALLSVTEAGETLDVALTHPSESVLLSLARPRVLHGLEERQLLDPDYSPEGEWPEAPLLGLGFGLRLIASLAQAIDVKFRIEDERFVLILPAATPNAQSSDFAALSTRTMPHHGEETNQPIPSITHTAGAPAAE